MTRPEDPFEALSYDLNQLRERRIAERRAVPRGGPDRRTAQPNEAAGRQPPPEVLPDLPE